jgi:hypothetical protein
MTKYVSDLIDPNLKNINDRKVVTVLRKETFLALGRLYEKLDLTPAMLRESIDRLKSCGYVSETEFLGKDVISITKLGR